MQTAAYPKGLTSSWTKGASRREFGKGGTQICTMILGEAEAVLHDLHFHWMAQVTSICRMLPGWMARGLPGVLRFVLQEAVGLGGILANTEAGKMWGSAECL